MSGTKEFIQSWEGACAAISGAILSTWGLVRLVPRIFRVCSSFYYGAAFTLEIREHMAEMRKELISRLDDLDEGQRNMIEVRWQVHDRDEDAVYFTTDEHGRTTRVSKTWTKWTGLDVDSARGSGWELGVAPEDRERVIRAWQQAVDHERAYEDEFSYVDREGNRIPVHVYATVIHRKDGAIMNWFGFAHIVGKKTVRLDSPEPR